MRVGLKERYSKGPLNYWILAGSSVEIFDNRLLLAIQGIIEKSSTGWYIGPLLGFSYAIQPFYSIALEYSLKTIYQESNNYFNIGFIFHKKRLSSKLYFQIDEDFKNIRSKSSIIINLTFSLHSMGSH